MEKFGMYTGYIMNLPVTANDKINIKTLPALMHESTHVLDYLLNPKFLKNESDFFDLPHSAKYFEFYEKYFYKLGEGNINAVQILKTAHDETEKFIRELPVNIKITFLKFMRFCMQMEQHAYKQDIHYAKILKKLGKPVDQEELKDYNKILLFPQKIKIVENFLAQTIKDERNKLKPLSLIQRLKNIFIKPSNTNV